jgi:hypothetical protein
MPKQTSRQHRQRYYTIPQFKNYSGLGERFLRDAVKDRDNPLPHFRLNRKTILVCTDDFDEWLQRYRVDSENDLDRVVDEMIRGL